MSYSRANELLKKELLKKGWTQQNFDFTACRQEGLQQLLHWVCQADFFRDMGAGAVSRTEQLCKGVIEFTSPCI